MIELHLIGYTSDLRYLVLDLEPEGGRGRYRLVVDGDLLLTLDELRDLRAQSGLDVGIPYERLEERLGIVVDRGEHARGPVEPPSGADTEPTTQVTETAGEEPLTARPPTSQPPPAPPPDDPGPPAVRVVDAMEPSVEEQREWEAVSWRTGADEAGSGPTWRGGPDEPGVRDEPEDEAGEEPEEEQDGPLRSGRSEEPERTGGSERIGEPERTGEPEEPGSGEPEEPEPERPEHPERPDAADDGAGGRADRAPSRPAPAEATSAERTSDGVPAPGRDSGLTPAQIQARLRAGRRPESVAEEAGTDVAWVERWLPPILTERAQVLQEARSLYLERPRKGRSHAPLGESVAANLRRRHLDPDEDAEWSVKRRTSGRWSINVRYRYRNKTRSATWALDREEGELTASSKAARDLGWTDGS